MFRKRIKAKFIGEGIAMGFVNGKEYELLMSQESTGKMRIEWGDEKGVHCLYDGQGSFKKDWDWDSIQYLDEN